MRPEAVRALGEEPALHPLVRAAGEAGRLPSWVRVDARRRAHLERVAALIGGWAEELGRSPRERVRWRAAGLLHDALKGDDPDELRIWAGRDWPAPLRHGPALAARLRSEGVRDDELLLAVAYHSVGHPSFEELGQYLYLADFLDPGRRFRETRRRGLRERLPRDREAVLVEVAALRLGRVLESRHSILRESVEFWNRLVGA